MKRLLALSGSLTCLLLLTGCGVLIEDPRATSASPSLQSEGVGDPAIDANGSPQEKWVTKVSKIKGVTSAEIVADNTLELTVKPAALMAPVLEAACEPTLPQETTLTIAVQAIPSDKASSAKVEKTFPTTCVGEGANDLQAYYQTLPITFTHTKDFVMHVEDIASSNGPLAQLTFFSEEDRDFGPVAGIDLSVVIGSLQNAPFGNKDISIEHMASIAFLSDQGEFIEGRTNYYGGGERSILSIEQRVQLSRMLYQIQKDDLAVSSIRLDNTDPVPGFHVDGVLQDGTPITSETFASLSTPTALITATP